MPDGADLHSAEQVFLFLLLIVAVVAAAARKLNVPYSILLVLAGLAISFVPHVPRVPLNPDLIFLIFLPPLLYAAAWQTNWWDFRHNLISISMLAVGLVAFTVWGVAEFADRFITALDWKSGFLLGAVVATTDAIAATSIAKTIGLPKRIVDLLEGESLVNDATGLLALEFGLGMLLRNQTPDPGLAALRLLWLVAAGIGVGLILGMVTAWVERWVDDGPVEVVISLIVPYVAYLVGEEVRASGVLAVVACGLFLRGRSTQLFSAGVRMQVGATWQGLNFTLNGLVFLLIGLQLPYVVSAIRGYSIGMLIRYGLIFSVVMVLLRLAWMYPASVIAFWLRTHLLKQKLMHPRPREIFVVGWTGMRGVVALAAALSLPETLGDGRPFAQRNLIIFLTFSVILATLVVQGLTLPALIRFLGLAGASSDEDEVRVLRPKLLSEAIAFLEQQGANQPDGNDHPSSQHQELLERYRHRLAAMGAGDQNKDVDAESASAAQKLRELAREVVQVERRELNRMRDSGQISDEGLRRLERELDLREVWQDTQA